MPIGITEDHEALREVVRRFVEQECPPAVPRAVLDADHEERPPFWAELTPLGWLGLHVDEEHGGSGFGMVEQCIVIEELGRAAAPGSYVPTVLAAAVLTAARTTPAAKSLLPELVEGRSTGAVALAGAGVLTATVDAASDLVVSGTVEPVLGGHLADVVIAPVSIDGTDSIEWVALDASAAGVTVTELPSVDRVRRV